MPVELDSVKWLTEDLDVSLRNVQQYPTKWECTSELILKFELQLGNMTRLSMLSSAFCHNDDKIAEVKNYFSEEVSEVIERYKW